MDGFYFSDADMPSIFCPDHGTLYLHSYWNNHPEIEEECFHLFRALSVNEILLSKWKLLPPSKHLDIFVTFARKYPQHFANKRWDIYARYVQQELLLSKGTI